MAHARECRDLNSSYFGTDITSELLGQDVDAHPHLRKVKEVIEKKDRDLMLTQHVNRVDMPIVMEIDHEKEVGWLTLPWIMGSGGLMD